LKKILQPVQTEHNSFLWPELGPGTQPAALLWIIEIHQYVVCSRNM